jgi:hypothetical protein
VKIIIPHIFVAGVFLMKVSFDKAKVSDLSVSRDNSDLAEDDPHDLTMTSKPEAPI